MTTTKKPRTYTFGEEIGNAVSHGAMAAATLGGIAPVSIHAFVRHGTLAAASVSVFMCSLFLMFLSSTLYHSMKVDTRQRQVLQILDHIAIYVAIAGTYTPIALLVIGGWQGVVVASLQWTMVIFGILYKSIAGRKIPKVSLTIYLIMGWSIVFVAPMFIRNASLGMQLLILAGGIFYSAGTYFYAKKDKRFFHMVWHFFVSLGAVCHFLGILLFL
ncbi:MAG: hemolysin III family protein [Clostridiales bacterium]|jgi:hemolysin III|nr:hemolysin III family protein [Clostridiales bacterium]